MNERKRKVCGTCKSKLIATTEFYYRDSNKKDGLRTNCIDCCKKYKRDNREKLTKQQREARMRNHEQYLESARKRYWKNREKNLEWNKKNYYKHIDRRKAYNKKFYRENSERIKEHVKRWAKENPKKVLAQSHLKRARKMRAIGKYSEEEFFSLCDEFNWKCCYCDKELSKDTATVDHAIPISKGGSNFIENILPACRSCNSSKNNKDLYEWFKGNDFYDIERDKRITNHTSKNNQMALF